MAEPQGDKGPLHHGNLDESLPIPADPDFVAKELVGQAQKFVKMSPQEAERLTTLIRDSIGERLGLIDDLRIGRVLGAALATL